jgi:uncharacterized protein
MCPLRNLCIALCAVVLATAIAASAKADADGPDFYRVTGVASDDVLNIRAEPKASSDKVGTIPHNAGGLKNEGCEGGLSFEQWSEASAAERDAANHRRWCRVIYEGVEGWVAGRFLEEGSAPENAMANPSFDCAKAAGDAEEEICSTPRLAQMDRELARLFHLAMSGANMSSEREPELKAAQRHWIKGRNDCGNSDEELSACIAASYAMRIDDIRTGYFDSRQDDAAGISAGPYAYVCDGLDAAISLVSVATDPAILSLRWQDNWITPVAVPAASGAKYKTQTLDENFEFWSKGDAARFTLSDGTVLACKRDDIG